MSDQAFSTSHTADGSEASDSAGRGEPSAPQTGDAAVDAAVADLAGLADRPLAEHHDALTAAHERLHGELRRDADQPAPGR